MLNANNRRVTRINNPIRGACCGRGGYADQRQLLTERPGRVDKGAAGSLINSSR